jgi:hypothetical protein
VAALIVLGLFYGGSASADGESTDPAAGTVVTENEPVLHDLCRTDDGGLTYRFVSGMPETELRDSDVYDGEDGYSVTGQADCDALEPPPPPPADSDADGLNDDADGCPADAENYNSYQDEDGCPDTPPENQPPPPGDSDGDGVNDDVDACPGVAPSVDEDGDGCEDEPVATAGGEIIIQATGLSVTINGQAPPVTVGAGASLTVAVTATLAAGENWRSTQWRFDGDNFQCADTTDRVGAGTFTESFVITAPATTTPSPHLLDLGVRANAACGGANTELLDVSVTVATTGTIRICKDFIFDNTTNTGQEADFTGDNGFTATFSLGDQECEPTVGGLSLTAGTTYTITETAVDDPFKLAGSGQGITCTGATASTVVEDEDNERVQITLAAGENIVCRFDNVEQSSGLQICKEFVGTNTTGLDADFTSDIPQFNMTLPNNLGWDCSPFSEQGFPTFVDLLPGNYNVTEDLDSIPEGFQLTDIDCGDFTGFTANLQTGALDITLEDNDFVTCTFTNTQFGGGCTTPAVAGFGSGIPGCVEICKVTSPAGADQGFTFSGEADFSLNPSSNQCSVFDEVPSTSPADFTETVPDGWALTNIACQTVGSVTVQYGVAGNVGSFGSTFEFGDDTARIILSGGAVGQSAQCVFTNTQADARLIICKQTDPENIDQDFSFTGDLGSFTLNDAVTAEECVDRDLPAGVYVVTEVIPTGWELTNIINGCDRQGDSTIEYGSGGVFDSTFTPGEDDSVRIDLAEGDLVSCVFVNNDITARIIICKATNPENFNLDFSFTGELGNFTVNPTGQCEDQSGLLPDEYDITEVVPSGWELTNIINGCDRTGSSTVEYGSGGTFDGTFTPGEDDSVRIDLAEGDLVSCVFVNTQVVGGGCTAATVAGFGTDPGCIEVCKVTVPAGADQDFDFGGGIILNASDPGTQCHADQQLTTPQTFDRTETVPLGWILTDIECQSAGDSTFQYGEGATFDVDFDPGDDTARISLAEGDDVQCIFSNTQIGGGCTVVTGFGCIEVCKVTSPPGANQDFAFTSDFGAFTLNASSDPCEVTDIGPGDWDVTEEIPGGWSLHDIACQSLGDTVSDSTFQFLGSGTTDTNFDPGDDLVRISLTVGDGVQCIFSNTQVIGGGCTPVAPFGTDPGCIEVCKVTDPPGASQTFEFESTLLGDFNLNASAAERQCRAFPGLDPGAYGVLENVPGGWVLSDIDCQADPVGSTFGYTGATENPTNGFELGDNTALVNLLAGANVQCVFTNTQDLGGDCLAEPTIAGFGTNGTGCIEICKSTSPAGADVEFTFDATDDLGLGFSLNAAEPDGDCIAFEELLAGDYDVTELTPSPPWFFTDIECEVVAGTGDSTFAEVGATVTISLADGEGVQCIFTNTQQLNCVPASSVAGFGEDDDDPVPLPACATIEVVKDLEAFDFDDRFDLQLDGVTVFNDAVDGSSSGPINVNPDIDHTVSEIAGNVDTNLGDYNTFIGCVDQDQNVVAEVGNDTSLLIPGAAIEPGDAIVCTITNNPIDVGECISPLVAGFGEDVPQCGFIQVCKNFLTAEATIAVADFETTYINEDGQDFNLGEEECFPEQQDTGVPLPPGSYGIQEVDVQAAFEFESLTCSIIDGQNQGDDSTFEEDEPNALVTVNLAAGDFVLCVFNNAEVDTGTIQICKDFVAAGSTAGLDADFIAPDAFGGGFSLEDGECEPLDGGLELVPGQYNFAELEGSLPDPFVLTAMSCLPEDPESVIVANPNANSLEITLVAGEDIVCTFVNTEEGLEADGPFVCKETDPESNQDFTFNIDLEIGEGGQHAIGDFTVTAGTCISLNEVIEAIGGGIVFVDQFSAVIEEIDPDGTGGWTLVDIDCAGDEDGIDLPAVTITFNPFEEVPTCIFFNERETPPDDDDADDDDADDDDDGRQPGQRQPRPDGQRGAGGKPGVGTGDGTFSPSADGGRNVILPALAFLGATGLMTLGFTHWQQRRR